MDFLSPSSASRDRDVREELEKKVAEQADQIKKLAEVASKYKMLVRENNMLKSSQKPGSLTEEVQKLLAELLKKDEQIKSVKSEAKSAIDSLKAKHQVVWPCLPSSTKICIPAGVQEQMDALMKQKDGKLGNCNPASMVSNPFCCICTKQFDAVHQITYGVFFFCVPTFCVHGQPSKPVLRLHLSDLSNPVFLSGWPDSACGRLDFRAANFATPSCTRVANLEGGPRTS